MGPNEKVEPAPEAAPLIPIDNDDRAVEASNKKRPREANDADEPQAKVKKVDIKDEDS